MPICDGEQCNASIPWRITAHQIQIANSAIQFDIETVRSVLSRIVTQEFGGTRLPPVGNKAPIFKSLCQKCWHAQSKEYDNPKSNRSAFARSTTQSCIFHTTNNAFKADQRPDPERIVSCVFHELMHFWSFNSNGLRQFNSRLNVDWDEAIADMLGYLTYKCLFRGHDRLKRYHTPFYQYATGLERARDHVQSMPVSKWKSWIACGSECNALPNDIKDFIHIHSQPHMRPSEGLMKIMLAQIVQELLFEAFVTWFFTGPDRIVASIGSNCHGFLTPQGIGRLIQANVVFPTYNGRPEQALPV